MAVRLGEDNGRQALLVEGVVQSISPHDSLARGGYWAAMLPPAPPRNALILGLGGGTLATLLAHRWEQAPRIVGVDDDAEILGAAREAEWLNVPTLQVVQADAFAFVEETPERFDYVAVDLYRGPHFQGRALTKVSLQRLRTVLDPPGWVAINLFLDRYTRTRIERIQRVLRVQWQVRVGTNVVVHARAR